MTRRVASPLKWIGGKHASARRMLAAFPPAHRYETSHEPCGGAAHVLMLKPKWGHREISNDLNDGAIEPLERAVLWFSVLRGTSTGWLRASPTGWNNSLSNALAYRSVLSTFAQVQERLTHPRVLIDNRDVQRVLEEYDSPTTPHYVGPPYIGAEYYYQGGARMHAKQRFDHKRLVERLNAAQGYVALSYSPHANLESWYPADRWRRITWQVQKVSAINGETPGAVQTATEMLLCNYAPPAATLWEQPAQETEASA